MAEWLKATDCKSVLSEYVGSNPTPSTISILVVIVSNKRRFDEPQCGSSSAGRASVFQTECREFESRLPLQTMHRLGSLAAHVAQW
jgi:hypothetical protein